MTPYLAFAILIHVLMLGEDGGFKFKERSPYQGWSEISAADLKGVVLNGLMPVKDDR